MPIAAYAKPNTPHPKATGPRTPDGKAVAARNATTHGLFARDIVLPSLGEDPQGYTQILDELNAQIKPHTLLERHYVEKIAAASWRLRRLHRWQAQLFEDRTLTEDERLDKLDKVLRHENHLHRQIDTAVKMLNKDVPQLHTRRAREEARQGLTHTVNEGKRDLAADLELTVEADRLLKSLTAFPEMDYEKLDAMTVADECQNCQNELSDSTEPAPDPMEAWLANYQKCENERKLATLAHDVSETDAEGRPIYVDDNLWSWMRFQTEVGLPERAAEFAEKARLAFLRDQEDARALLVVP
jgi:hypothetical protein